MRETISIQINTLNYFKDFIVTNELIFIPTDQTPELTHKHVFQSSRGHLRKYKAIYFLLVEEDRLHSIFINLL